MKSGEVLNHKNDTEDSSNSIEQWYEIEALIRENQDRDQTIFHNTHTPMLFIESESGNILDGNPAACDYYGYSRETIIQKNISDINILSYSEIAEEMGKAKKEERKYFKFKHRLANGKIRDVEVYSGPIIMNGRVVLFSIIHDIQEKIESIKNFKIHETYLKNLFENSPEAIAMVDNDFNILNINKSFEEIFLYRKNEVLGHNIKEVLCDENYYNESLYFKECIDRGEFIRKETLRKRKDGKLIEVSLLGCPIYFKKEKIGVYCIYSDLSKIKEEERMQKKRVQNHLNLLKNTIDSIPDVISVLKSDLTIELMNESGCRYFNLPFKKIKGASWNQVIQNKFGQAYYCTLQALISKECGHSQECVLRDSYLDLYSKPVFDENGEIILIVVVLRDISKEKKYEAVLRDSKEKAEEANRLKTNFLTNISHEIRTPMNGIIGIIEMLKEKRLSKEQEELTEMLNYSAERLLSIINDVLDVSKIEDGKLELNNEWFDINLQLSKIIKYFRIQAEGKGLKFASNTDMSIPEWIYGDFERLNQILFNLLGNAVKFTEKGTIYFQVKNEFIKSNIIELTFIIRDTGIGIKKEDIKNLFQNFYQLDTRTNKKFKGTGIGLALSQKLANLMGGEIYVHSDYGVGSTFSFKLIFDSSSEKTETINRRDDSEEWSFLKNLNILVAEDEKINQIIIDNMFKKYQCKVTFANNGEQVLDLIKISGFDAILMDICMPEMDGIEVTRRIREDEKESGEHIPIIALTAVAMKEDREYCLQAGMDDYLSKPIKKKEVFHTLSKHLKSEKQSKCSVNLDVLLEKLEGDKALMNEIVRELISDDYHQEFLQKIEESIQKSDYSYLKQILHKFKGSVSCFEFKAIDEAFQEMNHAIKETNTDVILQSSKKLKKTFMDFREQLIHYLEEDA